ncbi:IclR family transcriptional regulator [Metabacillus litoralis]|uniref:IclR family transcriptional regulator n=1 Tax=Metabacillus TaxID=2675233 RepID=UPI001B90DCD2|nr:IclR family transcriptional regulator [Metabacillus litoralis]UHA60150.1 IclR family transcriptional regulator [Metabacillus litoralis]
MSGVIHKSMVLLSLLKPSDEKYDWSTTEISKEIDIPVQTVHRLLNCLCEVGFVVQNKATRRFSLGTKIVDLGLSIRENNSIRNSALPYLIELSKQTKENVYLSIVEGLEGVVLDCVSATKPIYHFHSEIKGIRLPLSIEAPNKVLLAHLNLNTRDKIISELLKQNLVDDRNALESELRVIKQYGFSLTFGEKDKDVTSIAAPLFSWDDTVVAAISISIYSSGLLDQLNTYIDAILKCSKFVSKELGWIGT